MDEKKIPKGTEMDKDWVEQMISEGSETINPVTNKQAASDLSLTENINKVRMQNDNFSRLGQEQAGQTILKSSATGSSPNSKAPLETSQIQGEKK